MQFTILSHAGLLVEHRDVRLVVDPWLLGSCYWRSWWNFPEPPAALIENLRADFVYLTHLHWDHFHGPSLRKCFAPDTTILVPKVPTRRMVEDLASLGFSNVIEMPHDSEIRLGEDFVMRSYQSGPGVDSAIVVSAGGLTLFDCNDCKLFGLPLDQITARYPSFDFVLRSYSSASPIPYCIDQYERHFPAYRSRGDYMDEFSRFALHVNARHAIPFASNHCFLHADTLQFNDTAVSTDALVDRYSRLAAEAGLDSRCVLMPPGSRWSGEGGFEVVPFDPADRDNHIWAMLERHHDALQRQQVLEDSTLADYPAFERYFTAFVAAMPWPVRRWLGERYVFRTRDARGVHHWLVDLRSGLVADSVEAPDQCIVIETPALVLNDCTRIRMFSSWSPSKRLRVFLPSAAKLRGAMLLFHLLDLFELETLPLSRNFAPRSIAVRLRRWREAVEFARVALVNGVMRRPFSMADRYALGPRAGT